MAPVALVGGGVDRDFYDLSFSEWQRETTEQAKVVEAAFDTALSASGVSGEWRATQGVVADTVASHASCADLTILAANTEEKFNLGSVRWLVEQVLLTSGRPVLLLPEPAPVAAASPGAHVLVGWDGSRVAVRAVHDALPLLKTAASVTVLTIDAEHAGDPEIPITPATDLAPHLARHGVRVEAAHAPPGDLSPVEVLLRYATEHGSDLLVAGGYGHSRIRELVLGGATRQLLADVRIPVLLSH
jgi:nucleotide-binding universal stress UspA family protein